MANYYVALTDYGKSFIANAQANTQLALTHVVLGDANNQPYLPESRLNQTKLVHQTAKLPVASVKVVNSTTAEVSAVVPSNVGGWNLHEVGITDSSGKLVYVGNFHGGYRPTLTEGAGGDMELVITIKADNLATVVIEMDSNVVSATRKWALDTFVPLSHLDDEDPHNQYVLKTVYDPHVLQNNEDHQVFNDWQSEHITAAHPHSQYLLRSEYDAKMAELDAKIAKIAMGESIGGGDAVAVLALSVSGLADSKSHVPSAPATIKVTEQTGLLITHAPTALTIRGGTPSYPMTFKLPSDYNSETHRVVVTGSTSYVIDESAKTVTFTMRHTTESYTTSNGGDSNDYTAYRYRLSDSMRVEIYLRVIEQPDSGLLKGMIDLNYNGSLSSSGAGNASIAAVVNESSGLTFTYPDTTTLNTPIADTPNSYDKTVVISLPIEYSAAIHRLSISTNNGSYSVDESAKTVTFTARVNSVRSSAEGNEVTDTLNANLRVSMYNI